ncbi:tektin-like protein 1 [Corticium candelabrum]|uniref:tektin-like protein 1 n=1 Tax=Corticium candelabrum TaxID=121492 RepID=UPI002E27610F|nr:tektin-like protein 1 [Corticium candelabrum]
MTEKTTNGGDYHKQTADVKSILKARPQSARAVLQTVAFSQKLRAQVSSLVPPNTKIRPTPNLGAEVRKQTNSHVMHHVREQRHNAAVLRKSLAGLEEEVKILSRAKSAVEVSLQNTRKKLLTSHRALIMRERMHQHMQHGAGVMTLRRESAVLSRSKHDLEAQHQSIKQQLQQLDRMRRTVKVQLALLSDTLDMSNNAFKIYQSNSQQASKHHLYETACHAPRAPRQPNCSVSLTTTPHSKVQGVIQEADAIQAISQSMTQHVRQLLVQQEDIQKQAQDKVTQTLQQEVEQFKSQKRSMMMERGEMRVAHNMALRLQNQQEVSLGLTLGPHCSKHRLVAQHEDRPLTKRKEGSTANEHKAIKQSAAEIEKDLTATRSSAAILASTSHSMAFGIQAKQTEIEREMGILHLRKKANNKWVL